MGGDNRELAFSLILDQNGKPFVKQVGVAVGQAAAQGTQSISPLRQAFADIISTRSLIRLASGTFLFRRLAQAADEPNRSLKQTGVEIDALTGKLGNELQGAIASVGEAFRPAIRAFTNADGSIHGVVLGMGALVTLGPPVINILRLIGLSGGPVTAALAAGFLLAGAAIGKIGEEAAEAEAALSRLAAEIRNMTQAQIDAKRTELLLDIARITKELDEARDKAGSATEALGKFGRPDPRLAKLESDLNKAKEALKTFDDLLGKVNLERAVAKVRAEESELTREIGLQIALWNLQIAMGGKSLAQVREDARQRRQNAELSLNELKDHEQIKEREAEILQLKQFDADLGKRISEQTTKAASEVRHRQILEAQIVDALNQQGPVMELLAVQEQQRAMIAAGHNETEIQMLELKKQEIGLQQQVTANLQSQVDAAMAKTKEESQALEAEQRANAERLAFQRQIALSVARLAGEVVTRIREQRIRQLREELELTNLTATAIQEKEAQINVLSQLDPLAAEQQKQGLNELITLLGQAQEDARRIPEELQLLASGMEQATQSGTRALVRMFTRGKTDAKQFAEDIAAIIEEMAAKLLASALIKLLLSIFNPGASFLPIGVPGGGGGGNFDWFGITGGPGGTTPRIPLPSAGGGAANWGGEISRMRRDIAGMRDDITALRESEFRQSLSAEIPNDHIRVGFHRAEKSAGGRKA